MIDKWLHFEERTPCEYSKFTVIDVKHTENPSLAVKHSLVELLRDARIEPDLMQTMTEQFKAAGWNDQDIVACLVSDLTPEQEKTRRGEFGETLFCAMLEQFHDYSVPVIKLRYKMTSGQCLPSTDVLGLKFHPDGTVMEVCYTECKLRTSKDYVAAVKAAKQLEADYKSKTPDILAFVVKQLYRTGSPLTESFMGYLADRKDTKAKDHFRIGLCWENEEWTETVLRNLEKEFPELPALVVHLIRINNLGQLTDEIFAELGITQVSDDD